MHNIYGISMDKTKQGHAGNDDFSDDNDDDYENTNPVAPVVPSREKRRMKTAVKNELPLKRNISQEVPKLQIPTIGLDFSSGAVNAAFADVTEVKSSSFIVNEGFRHLEGMSDGQKQKKSRRCSTQVLTLVVLVILFFILVVLTGFMLLRYSTISEELIGLQHNASHFQTNVKEEQKNLKTEVKDLNQVMEKIQEEIMTSIKHIDKTLDTICSSCPSGWTMVNTTCYYISEATLSWDGAREECYKLSSVLVIIKDNKKMDSIKKLLKNGRRYWIGLRRDPKEIHRWKWLDGSEMAFSNWAVNEPNYYSSYEHCGETVFGPWNDRNCDDKSLYICQRIRIC